MRLKHQMVAKINSGKIIGGAGHDGHYIGLAKCLFCSKHRDKVYIGTFTN